MPASRGSRRGAWRNNPIGVQMRRATRYPYGHGRTLTKLAARTDRSAVQFHQLLDQGQSNARTFMSARLQHPAAKEAFEHPRQVLWRHPATAIRNFQLYVV